MKLFITGKPKAGKTTLIKKIYGLYPGIFAGFWTEEIRERGNRVGFRIITTNGDKGILAHINFKTRKVGKYGVNVEEFERIVLPILQGYDFRKLLLVDEIGKMELLSERFSKEIRKIVFNDRTNIIATIPIKDVHPLVRDIRRRFRVILLTPDNRNEVFEMLRELLG